MLLESSPENSSATRDATANALMTEQLLHSEGVQRLSPCRRGTLLYSAGDPAASVCYLESGLAKILREGVAGRELLVTIARPGELFGEESMFGDSVRETTAEILADATVYSIPAELLLANFRETPGAWERMARFLAGRKRKLERKLELLFLRDVEQRILCALAELAGLYGAEDGSCQVRLSQVELASLIGSTRETTSCTLNAMARRGILTLGRRRITIPSIDALTDAIREPVPFEDVGTMVAGR